MGLIDSISPATSMVGGSFARISVYAWVLIPIVIIAGIFGAVFIFKTVRNKKRQWTHTLEVRKVLNDRNELSDIIVHNMRRFTSRTNVFELEKPLLGGYLFPELANTQALNTYKIIIDSNNRIYLQGKEIFAPDDKSKQVSCSHAEIDIQRRNFNEDWEKAHKTSKKLEWGTVMKYAFMTLGILCLTIMGIVTLQEWGEAQEHKSNEAKAMENAMTQLKEAMVTVQATVNTQKLLIPELKALKGTNNLQQLITSDLYNETT